MRYFVYFVIKIYRTKEEENSGRKLRPRKECTEKKKRKKKK